MVNLGVVWWFFGLVLGVIVVYDVMYMWMEFLFVDVFCLMVGCFKVGMLWFL